jgi:hypothetical protein
MRNLKTILLCLCLASCTAVATVNAKNNGILAKPKALPQITGAILVSTEQLQPFNMFVFTYRLRDGGCLRVVFNEPGTVDQSISATSCA